jgi:predicted regulator of Ras-like GTPase activity (Roadblock/LC7/MglB family)
LTTIRDLVESIRQRAGVDAAIVVGRDGLLIDGRGGEGVDTEAIAAHAPALIASAESLGDASRRGALTAAVLEYPGGLAIVSVLSTEAILLVLARQEADLGGLLFELRRNRERMAALV